MEAEALRLLLDGNDPVLSILRRQINSVTAIRRDHTGCGLFVDFTLSKNAPQLPGQPSFAFGDVIADIEELENGAGFVLFVESGCLKTLEIFAYDDYWPSEIAGFQVRYVNPAGRDISALHQIPGWPSIET